MRVGLVRGGFWPVLAAAMLVGLVTSGSWAQIPKAKVQPPVAKPGVTPGRPKAKVPDPEPVLLETKDGVSLKATYYPGTAKKDTVPVILIHGFGGSKSEYHAFALYLQSLGHASIAPDLRGHGQSTVQKLPNGATITLDADKMKRDDLEAMLLDVEACKKFLLEKNNSGDLNIELLTVIGADFGTIIATRWAAADWSVRDLPAYKQGRDVKALVLLSPMTAFKAVTIREAFTVPAVQSQLSIMFVAGAKDSKSTTEAKKNYDALQRHHPKLPEDPEERRRVQELYLVQPETTVNGTKLLADSVRVGQLSIKEMIGIFIDRRLVQRKAELAWQNRESPL